MPPRSEPAPVVPDLHFVHNPHVAPLEEKSVFLASLEIVFRCVEGDGVRRAGVAVDDDPDVCVRPSPADVRCRHLHFVRHQRVRSALSRGGVESAHDFAVPLGFVEPHVAGEEESFGRGRVGDVNLPQVPPRAEPAPVVADRYSFDSPHVLGRYKELVALVPFEVVL